MTINMDPAVLAYMPSDLPIDAERWNKLEQQAVTWLQETIRLDTTNPPGNETIVADWLCKILDSHQIRYDRIEAAPTRSNVIARMEAEGPAKGHEPLILMAHMDVVPALRDYWTQDPFGAALVDGWIYGRGAIDMKSMLVMNLITFIAIKMSGVKLSRDIILCAVADEEAGCSYGMRHLVEKHPSLVEARWGLNEVGGFPVWLGEKKKTYFVQVAEKGLCWFRVRIPGTPGHGSMPHNDNPIAKAAKLVIELQNGVHAHKATDPVCCMVDVMATELGIAGSVLKLILKPAFYPWVAKVLDDEQQKVFRAILHNTTNPTIISGGEKVNVIPSETVIEVDGRTLPGVSSEEFLAPVRAALPEGATVEIIKEGPPYVVSTETPLYNTIVETLHDADPGVPVVPSLISGFTDSKWYDPAKTTVYGFSPMQFPPEVKFTELFHGHDERIPEAGFRWGTRVHLDTVSRFCIAKN